MKQKTIFFLILYLISSCKKDDMSWNLKRTSPKDAKLEVSEIIYSNDCSDQTGFQFFAAGPGTSSSIYWDLFNNGYKGICFKTQGNCTSASIKLNFFINQDGILRFNFKTVGLPNEPNYSPSVKINSTTINSAIISGNEDSNGEWLQLQTEILKAGNNELEIKFNSSSIKTFYVDEIELWSPLY